MKIIIVFFTSSTPHHGQGMKCISDPSPDLAASPHWSWTPWSLRENTMAGSLVLAVPPVERHQESTKRGRILPSAPRVLLRLFGRILTS